jgi:hypothetical protein
MKKDTKENGKRKKSDKGKREENVGQIERRS